MKKMFRLHKKQAEQEPTTDLHIDTMTITQFKKFVTTQDIPKLRGRSRELSKYLAKLQTLPLELPNEKMKRRKKLRNFLQIMTEHIHKKEAKLKLISKKQKAEYVKTQVLPRLCNLRFASGSQINNLKAGLITSDAVKWEKPTGSVCTFTTGSGRRLKIDLLKIISPDTWKQIFDTPYTTYFFPIEKVSAIRNGKPLGKWRDGKESFLEEQKIRQIPHTFLGIRYV